MHGVFSKHTPRIEPCISPPFSFFEKIEGISPNRIPPLNRFCSLMRKMGANIFVHEQLELDSELNDEKIMLEQCGGNMGYFNATRWTLFRVSNKTSIESKFDDLELAEVLGYAVIVNFNYASRNRTYLHECVVSSPTHVIETQDGTRMTASVCNYYIHNRTDFRTTVGTTKNHKHFQLNGSFFAQQNGISHVCAHAALRTAINSSPVFSLNQPKLTNKAINDHLNLNPSEAKNGLNNEQMQLVLGTYNGTVHWADFHEKPAIDYEQFVYPIMESGCPVILNVEGWCYSQNNNPPSGPIAHALAILGHTLNSDRWEPEAKLLYQSFPIENYISAASYTDHFIIADDNSGMYISLSVESMRNLIIPQKNPSLHATAALGILPDGVSITGQQAEELGAIVAKNLIRYVDGNFPTKGRWLKAICERALVCRTILRKKEEYINHLSDTLAQHGNTIPPPLGKMLASVSNYIWVTELSVPNIYSANKHKLGEVLIDAMANEATHRKGHSWSAIIIPEHYCIDPNSPTIQSWPINTHIPVIRLRSSESRCEW
jgi:hypothetical protein